MLRRIFILVLTLAAGVAIAPAKKADRPPLAADVTLYGQILCEGEPMAGVLVSDGVLFTKTDSTGYYVLPSKKTQGAVFMITPSGYEPTLRKGSLPQFWSALKSHKPERVERHDFALVRRNNDRHRILFSADYHLSNRNEDLLQLRSKVIPALTEAAAEAERDTLPVYSIAVGDLGINSYWYSSEFDVGDALSFLASSRYPTPLYTAMGENDHDGAIPNDAGTDYNSERMYVYSCGPRYWSMNIGKVHYVVLDDTVFRNEAGEGPYPSEIVGKRNYDRFLTLEQIMWLVNDLSFIDRDTPLVICLHHAAFRATSRGNISPNFTHAAQLDPLLACLRGFKQVHIVSGHTHRRRVSVCKEQPHITQHELPSISGNSWTTGYNDLQQLCPDGTPAGFEIFTFEGDSLRWEYRSVEHGDYPFRVYDMNTVRRFYTEEQEARNFVKEYPVRVDFADEDFENYVYVNFWGYEPKAKIEIIENGKPLKVKRIHQEDPLYTRSWDMFRLKTARKKPTIRKNNCQHLFRAKCSSPTSTVIVRTTDPFGKVHEQSVERPKPFTTDMK